MRATNIKNRPLGCALTALPCPAGMSGPIMWAARPRDKRQGRLAEALSRERASPRWADLAALLPHQNEVITWNQARVRELLPSTSRPFAARPGLLPTLRATVTWAVVPASGRDQKNHIVLDQYVICYGTTQAYIENYSK